MSNGKPKEDVEFVDVMSSLGVRPLSGREQTSDKRVHNPPPPAVKSSPRNLTGVGGSADSGVVDSSVVSASEDQLKSLQERISQLEEQVNQAQTKNIDLCEALKQSRMRLKSTESDLEKLKSEEKLLQDQVCLMKNRLEGSKSALPDLLTTLSECGIVGEDEARFMMQSMSQQRLMGPLLANLSVLDSGLFAAMLSEKVSLLCSNHLEFNPPNRARVTVMPSRCELCGGREVRRVVRRFEDACLMNGYTRVGFVGVNTKQCRLIDALINHPRLTIQYQTHHTLKEDPRVWAGVDVVVVTDGSMDELGSLDQPLIAVHGARSVAEVLAAVDTQLQ